MMISNEERREVARKLRERTKKPMGKSMQRMFTETLGIYAHHISWMNPDKATNRWDVIVNYLAELIDRPALALSVVLLAALAIYWHAEARDWAQIAMLAIDAVEDLERDRSGKR